MFAPPQNPGAVREVRLQVPQLVRRSFVWTLYGLFVPTSGLIAYLIMTSKGMTTGAAAAWVLVGAVGITFALLAARRRVLTTDAIVSDGTWLRVPTEHGSQSLPLASITQLIRAPEGLYFCTANRSYFVSGLRLGAERDDEVLALFSSVTPRPEVHRLIRDEGWRATPFTAVFIALAIALFGVFQVVDALDHRTGLVSLLDFGLVSRGLVLHGQVYRLFAAALMHLSFSHLFLNLCVLWSVRRLEAWLGTTRFTSVFLISCVAGNLFVLAGNSLVVGSSTGIFGLMGLEVVAYLLFRDDPARHIYIPRRMLVIGVVLGAMLSLAPAVSALGHLGGFVGGLVASALFVPRPSVPALIGEAAAKQVALGLCAAAACAVMYMGVRPFVGDKLRQDLEAHREHPTVANSLAWQVAVDPQASREDLEAAASVMLEVLEEDRSKDRQDTGAELLRRLGRNEEAAALSRAALAQSMEPAYAATLAAIPADASAAAALTLEWSERGWLLSAPASARPRVVFLRLRVPQAILTRVVLPASVEDPKVAIPAATDQTRPELLRVFEGPLLTNETSSSVSYVPRAL